MDSPRPRHTRRFWSLDPSPSVPILRAPRLTADPSPPTRRWFLGSIGALGVIAVLPKIVMAAPQGPSPLYMLTTSEQFAGKVTSTAARYPTLPGPHASLATQTLLGELHDISIQKTYVLTDAITMDAVTFNSMDDVNDFLGRRRLRLVRGVFTEPVE